MAVSPDEDRLYQTIAAVLGVAPDVLSEHSSPQTIAGWDSLNHLNLIIALEAEYAVDLSPEDAVAMRDVASIRRILGEYGKGAHDAISLVDCRNERLPALKAFLDRSYGSGYVLSTNDAHFRWQFGATPPGDADRYHMRLAIVDGQVAGCLGYIPVEIQTGARVLRGGWLANWMVDPRCRHLGLGPLLGRDVARQFDVTLALGSNQQASDLLQRMGWTDFGFLPRYVYVLDRDRAKTLTEDGRLSWPEATGPQPPKVLPGTTVASLRRFDDSVTQLWDRLFAENAFVAATRRTASFLNWRYADHPQFRYRLLEARRSGRPAGFAVYRVEEARGVPVRVARLVELVGESDVLPALVATVLCDARSLHVAAIDFFCPARCIADVLTRHGFLAGEHPAARRIPILYQPIDRRRTRIRFMANLQKIPGADDLGAWYVTKSDGDQDRPT